MPSRLHEQFVDRLVSGGARRNGFRKTLRGIFARCGHEPGLWAWTTDDEVPDCPHTNERCDPEIALALIDSHVVPDAFAIDLERHIVTAYEVNASIEMRDEKMNRYCGLWMAFDAHERWSLELVSINRWGQSMVVDLPAITLVKDCIAAGVVL